MLLSLNVIALSNLYMYIRLLQVWHGLESSFFKKIAVTLNCWLLCLLGCVMQILKEQQHLQYLKNKEKTKNLNDLFYRHARIWPWWLNPFLVFFHLIIILAKGKISKSVNLFVSHIEPKWCCSIRLLDFKSNISLEQSNEIVYFFTCWYQKLNVDGKILRRVWPEMVMWPSWSQGNWMNEWMNLADFSCWYKAKKVKNGHRTLILMNV